MRPYFAPRIDRIAEVVRAISHAVPPDVAVEPPVAIKLLRDVGLGEIGLVLPGAAIRYRLRDLVFVGSGAAGGIFSKLLEKPVAALLAPKILLALFGAAVARGLLGMRRSRLTLDKLREEYENRHLQATRMNAVEYFLREAAEMDAKEALLAYAFALLERLEGAPRVSLRHLAAQIEVFLRVRLRAEVVFDVDDAARALEALGLVSGAPDPLPDYLAPGPAAAPRENGAVEVLAPAEALSRVRRDLRARLGLEEGAPALAEIFTDRFTL